MEFFFCVASTLTSEIPKGLINRVGSARLCVCCECMWQNVKRAEDLAQKQTENIVSAKQSRL